MSTQSLLVISAGHKGDRFPTFQKPWTLGLVWYTTVILVPGKLSHSILGSILTWATQCDPHFRKREGRKEKEKQGEGRAEGREGWVEEDDRGMETEQGGGG